ncbi:Slp family lipoprotein [Kaarinaea lacus]
MFLSFLVPALLLSACAVSPEFPTEGVDMMLTPQRAVAEIESTKGRPVIWGGVIISSTNRKDTTELEILAYPLDVYQRPNDQDQAWGRFLAIQPGYLETTDYAQGRVITVKGILGVTRNAKVGESDYVYPVVNINQLHLWPKESEYVEPRVRFGIGVMIRN